MLGFSLGSPFKLFSLRPAADVFLHCSLGVFFQLTYYRVTFLKYVPSPWFWDVLESRSLLSCVIQIRCMPFWVTLRAQPRQELASLCPENMFCAFSGVDPRFLTTFLVIESVAYNSKGMRWVAQQHCHPTTHTHRTTSGCLGNNVDNCEVLPETQTPSGTHALNHLAQFTSGFQR